jgi:CDP-diacylglycerol--glycerol-3-phosphate 3-phosphatidyltransferase
MIAKEHYLNRANWISVSRILWVPLVLFLLQFPELSIMTAGLYGVLCFSDALDGYVARRLNQVTDLGKFLDPLADKLVVDLPLIYFTSVGLVSAWPVILIIGREFFVTGLRLLAASRQQIIAADQWGKLKTVVQMVTVTVLILRWPAGEFLAWGSAGFGVFSGVTIWKQAKGVFKSF